MTTILYSRRQWSNMFQIFEESVHQGFYIQKTHLQVQRAQKSCHPRGRAQNSEILFLWALPENLRENDLQLMWSDASAWAPRTVSHVQLLRGPGRQGCDGRVGPAAAWRRVGREGRGAKTLHVFSHHIVGKTEWVIVGWIFQTARLLCGPLCWRRVHTSKVEKIFRNSSGSWAARGAPRAPSHL